MSFRRSVPVTAMAVLSLVLAGCGGSSEEASAAGGKATVDHVMGSTEVTCEPKRVVTLGQGETDSTLALGVTPVGAVNPWTDDWYTYLPDGMDKIQRVGTETEPDLEAIAALQPDLILGSKLRHEALYDQLSQIAPTVYTETIGVVWKQNISLYAQAMCLEEKAEEVVGEYDARTEDLAAELDEKGLGDTEVSIIRFMPDQVRIYLTGFPGSVIRDVGLPRPKPQTVEDWDASPQLVEISEERIPDMDGDVIFEMVSASHYAQDGSQTIDEQLEYWTSTQLWKDLSAVKAGKVETVDESHWNLGGGIQAANALLDDLEEYFLQTK